MASSQEEAKLERYLQWLQVNGAELHGCKIKYSDSNKGFGIFSANDVSDGVLLVVHLDLAITPMRVLQDPLLGPECRAMFEEGDVDDRFLMILYLTVECLRKNSSWKPYLDMLPTTFGNPLWFTDDELLELKGTTWYRAMELQKKSLVSLYDDKLKALVKKLLTLDRDLERDMCFEDFLWANSLFWTRALNIPLPYSYVFPKIQEDSALQMAKILRFLQIFAKKSWLMEEMKVDVRLGVDIQVSKVTSPPKQNETVWVEGLVPGIDFCNHDIKAAATWEVDETGLITGVPNSWYLLSAGQPLQIDAEIFISYGSKGNEELLYLHGFVLDDNPDDYLMVHYPVEAIQNVPFADSIAQLLEAQKGETRCLLPRSLLDHGFFAVGNSNTEGGEKCKLDHVCSYSWSGQCKMPSYSSRLVFPETFLTALRTIAMKEDELFQVSLLLEELVQSREGRQPSDSEVQAAVWETCGDSGALQILVDLLNSKMTDLQESSGTEDCDTSLLENEHITESATQQNENNLSCSGQTNSIARHKSAS
ncbi:LOW QUALITY PROTEIN: ribosomal lysine N-methyltransferase set10 [Malus domestica]|uniref:LOW QUALITY PROTEIN: ribosomal lysine N-methyltransferase set10 n=1 Tax=Malus domestica TaxID=3750 RepID=UPI0039756C86